MATHVESRRTVARLEREFYLQQHPELRRMATAFLAECIEQQPASVVDFAHEFFAAAPAAHDGDAVRDAGDAARPGPALRVVYQGDCRDLLHPVHHGGLAETAQLVANMRMGLDRYAARGPRALPALWCVGGNVLTSPLFASVPLRPLQGYRARLGGGLAKARLPVLLRDPGRPNLMALDTARSGGCYPAAEALAAAGVDLIALGHKDLGVSAEVMLDVLERYPSIDWLCTNLTLGPKYGVPRDREQAAFRREINYHARGPGLALLRGPLNARGSASNILSYAPFCVDNTHLVLVLGLVEVEAVSINQLANFGATELSPDYVACVEAAVLEFVEHFAGWDKVEQTFPSRSLHIMASGSARFVQDEISGGVVASRVLARLFGDNIVVAFADHGDERMLNDSGTVASPGSDWRNLFLYDLYHEPVGFFAPRPDAPAAKPPSSRPTTTSLDRHAFRSHAQVVRSMHPALRNATASFSSSSTSLNPRVPQIVVRSGTEVDLLGSGGSRHHQTPPAETPPAAAPARFPQRTWTVTVLPFVLLDPQSADHLGDPGVERVRIESVSENTRARFAKAFEAAAGRAGIEDGGLGFAEFCRFLLDVEETARFVAPSVALDSPQFVDAVAAEAWADIVVGPAAGETLTEATRLFRYLDTRRDGVVEFDAFWELYGSRRRMRALLGRLADLGPPSADSLQRALPVGWLEDRAMQALAAPRMLAVARCGAPADATVRAVLERCSVAGCVDARVTASSHVYAQTKQMVEASEELARLWYGHSRDAWYRPLVRVQGRLDARLRTICSQSSPVTNLVARALSRPAFCQQLAEAGLLGADKPATVVAVVPAGALRIDRQIERVLTVRDVCALDPEPSRYSLCLMSSLELLSSLVAGLSRKFAREMLFQRRPVTEFFPSLSNIGIVFNVDFPYERSFLFDANANAANTLEGAFNCAISGATHAWLAVVTDEATRTGVGGYFGDVESHRWKPLDTLARPGAVGITEATASASLRRISTIAHLMETDVRQEPVRASDYDRVMVWFTQRDDRNAELGSAA